MISISIQTKLREIGHLLAGRPDASAAIKGSKEYQGIDGTISFIQLKNGVLVSAEVFGLPKGNGKSCGDRIFALHLHEGSNCEGMPDDPFSNAGGHYNPSGCEHPYHAGDMPPLFSNDGYAFLVFFTNRFSVEQIIGRTMIIHSGVDDFTSQPSGNAGKRIACGVIR